MAGQKLTPMGAHRISQVIATMEIEDMHVKEHTVQDLISIEKGIKTTDQVINDVIKRYKND